MTSTCPDALRHLLAATGAVLVDFDGPVCDVFAGFPAPMVADQLRAALIASGSGHADWPRHIARSGDPFDLLRHAATLDETLARHVHTVLSARETNAVASATPTDGSSEFLRAWTATGRPVAIVSNNSALAVQAYVDLRDLRSHITHISARTSPDPDRLKPHPYLLHRALAVLGVAPGNAVMIGDSTTDMYAAAAAGTASIGYANQRGKTTPLAMAGATHVVRGIAELTASL